MKTSGPLFEYACHEGNYAMTNVLGGARAQEKKNGEGAGGIKKEDGRAEEREVPSGPSLCELGQSRQAETHPCRASGTEAGNQSRQGVQSVPCDGEVSEPPAALDKLTPFCRDLLPL